MMWNSKRFCDESIVSFLKLLRQSDVNPCGVTKEAHKYIITCAAFSTKVLGNGNNQVLLDKLSRTIRLYFYPSGSVQVQ